MTTNAPCQRCTDRAIGCHSKCPRYAEYRAVYVAAAEARKYDRTASDTLITLKQRHAWLVTGRPTRTTMYG